MSSSSSSVAAGTRSRKGGASPEDAPVSAVAVGAPLSAVGAGAPIPASERALRDLFIESMAGGIWGEELNVDVAKGSGLAAALVAKQCATSVEGASKALMEHPQWLVGLVFILVDEEDGEKCHVVWQIVEFHETTQTVVAKRVSDHEHREMADQTSFPLSMVEVLIAPTLPFLDRMLSIMGRTRDIAMAKFPVAANILTVSFGKFNTAMNRMDFDLLHVDGTVRNKLQVSIKLNTGLAGNNILEGQESTRRVRTVPTGTHHWFLCDECMLVGSRSEEIVYAAMIHGGSRSKPGESLQLGVGLYLRMNPKEARNLLSFRITSSASFDMITESELAALRYGTEKVEPHHWQLGDDAMLGYRRVRQCQEILYRLFKLKPYVMERWSFFAEQLLDIIENGRERFPGIARNGVVNKYVENVLQTLFAQVHTPGLTPVGADAALAALKLDITSPVFIRYQMDAEMATRSSGHGGGYKREPDVKTTSTAAPDKKKSRQEKAFCFSHFTTEGCSRGDKCRFSHVKPTSDADKALIREGIRARKGTLRPDAY
jgi:hypothetical protein